MHRDTNDFERRPAQGERRTRTIEYASATKGQPPEDVAKRHAESSPENPQGGRWVKLRVEAGGVPLGHDAMMGVLESHGYQRNPPEGKRGT